MHYLYIHFFVLIRWGSLGLREPNPAVIVTLTFFVATMEMLFQRSTWTAHFNTSVLDMLFESEYWWTSLRGTPMKLRVYRWLFFFIFSPHPKTKRSPVTRRCPICFFLPMTDVLFTKWEQLDVPSALRFAGVAFFLQHQSPLGGMFGVTTVTRGAGGGLGGGDWWGGGPTKSQLVSVGGDSWRKEGIWHMHTSPNDTTDAHLLLFSSVSSKNTLLLFLVTGIFPKITSASV